MPRLTADQWTEVRTRRETGESFGSLSKAFEINEAAICRRAKKEGWGHGMDVSAVVRRKVNEKVNGVLNGVDFKKTAQIIDAAAERGAALLRQHQQDWEAHRTRFKEVPADFEEGKHAKISAEMLKIRHDGERVAYRLDEPGGGNTDLRIVIERETHPWPAP